MADITNIIYCIKILNKQDYIDTAKSLIDNGLHEQIKYHEHRIRDNRHNEDVCKKCTIEIGEIKGKIENLKSMPDNEATLLVYGEYDIHIHNNEFYSKSNYSDNLPIIFDIDLKGHFDIPEVIEDKETVWNLINDNQDKVDKGGKFIEQVLHDALGRIYMARFEHPDGIFLITKNKQNVLF